MVIYCGLMGLYCDLMDYEWDTNIAIEHGPFSSYIYPLKIVIFNSYVKLPEGTNDPTLVQIVIFQALGRNIHIIKLSLQYLIFNVVMLNTT